MKILIALILTALFAFVFWQCKHTRYTLENLPKTQIRWGTGGGFTGKETSFAMLENGQMFRFVGVNHTSEALADIKSKTAYALFATAESLGITEVVSDAPGNLYYFLEFKKDDKTHRLVWGDKDNKPDQKVLDFYMVLQQLVAQEKEK